MTCSQGSELEEARQETPPADELESHILSVHVGHASNCSSVGSVIDFLFLSAAAGAALMAAVAAGLGSEATPANEPRAVTGRGETERDDAERDGTSSDP